MKELQAAGRAGVIRLCLKVDLVQRTAGGRDLPSFSRKALTELVALTAVSSALPPVRSLAVKGDVLSGYVDLLCGLAGFYYELSAYSVEFLHAPGWGPRRSFPCLLVSFCF